MAPPIPVSTTQPTSNPVVDRTGDLIYQTVEALQQTGVSETVLQTHWWQWTISAMAIFCGLVLGRLASGGLRKLSERAAEKVRLYTSVVLGSLAGPLGLFLFMIGLGIGLSVLVLAPVLREFLIRVFQLVNIFIIGWLLYGLVDIVALVLLRYARGRQGNLGVMLVPAARKTLRVMLVIVLILFAAENVFKQDVKALLAGLGIAGLAVSLAAQDSIRNLFGSVMIFADQPFAIGDRVKIADQEGIVEDIGFRSTRLRTTDGYMVTIPNANIAGAAVVNYSKRKSIRRAFDITLGADTPLDKVQQALATIRETLAQPDIASGFAKPGTVPPPTVTLIDPASLRVQVAYSFGSTKDDAYAAHTERLNLMLIQRLRELGITYR